MRKLFDHMDNTFRKAYDHYEEVPSAHVWSNINSQLDLMSPKKYGSSVLIKGFVILMIIGSSLVLFDLMNQTGNNSFLPPENKIELTIPQASPTNNSKENTVENQHQYKNLKTNIYPKIKMDQTIHSNQVIVLNEFNFPLKRYELKLPQAFVPGTTFDENMAFPIFTPGEISATTEIPVSYSGFAPYWTIAGILSNGYAAYKLDIDLPSNYQQMKQIRQRERNELSYAAGVYATYHFHKRFGIQTGIIYSNTQIQIDPQKIYAFDDPDGDIGFQYVTSSGYTFIRPKFTNAPLVGDSLNTTEAKHSFKTISLPLVLKYNNISQGKFSFHPGAGIIANYIISAGLETEVTDAFNRESVIVNKLRGTRNFYWSAYADAEFQYRIRPDLSINFRPAFSYAISPITDNNIVETFPYSITAGIGLTYKF